MLQLNYHATVLFLVMMFGIGFILNMLLKTTWFPIYLFVIVLIGLGIWAPWDKSANRHDRELRSLYGHRLHTGYRSADRRLRKRLGDSSASQGRLQNVLIGNPSFGGFFYFSTRPEPRFLC